MMQFELGNILHSVDNKDQAGRLINRHLIRDMRGNLRAYGQQKVRCTKCGTSYRRPPIAGKCIHVVKKDAKICVNAVCLRCLGDLHMSDMC